MTFCQRCVELTTTSRRRSFRIYMTTMIVAIGKIQSRLQGLKKFMAGGIRCSVLAFRQSAVAVIL
jgi:hypothetical protein